MQVDFYQLSTPLQRALPQIAQRVLASGERLLVVSGNEAQRAAIDRSLWMVPPDSFLPHAQAGADDDDQQPVLIAGEPAPTNAAKHIALIDGIWRDEALSFERAFHFFDGETVAAARDAWKALADREGVERRFWKQDETGRWQQAA